MLIIVEMKTSFYSYKDILTKTWHNCFILLMTAKKYGQNMASLNFFFANMLGVPGKDLYF